MCLVTINFVRAEIFFLGNGNRLLVVLVTRTMVLHHLCDVWEGPRAQEHPTTVPDAQASRHSDALLFFRMATSDWLGGGYITQMARI